MSIIWSLVWGLLTFAIMLITIKYYLPRLSERAKVSASEYPASTEYTVVNSEISFRARDNNNVIANKNLYRATILDKRVTVILMLMVCTCLAIWCGYTAANHFTTVGSMIKMTVAMGVLSCAFITDMELMIIPNVCSLVLIVCRVLTIMYEFIWTKDEAVAWLLNSVVALIVSLILLLIMSKVTHGGIGMGDVKLFSSLGFLCGIRAVCFTLMFAFLLCALASTGLLILKKKNLKDSLPLGPYIWLGYGVTVLLSIM